MRLSRLASRRAWRNTVAAYLDRWAACAASSQVNEQYGSVFTVIRINGGESLTGPTVLQDSSAFYSVDTVALRCHCMPGSEFIHSDSPCTGDIGSSSKYHKRMRAKGSPQY